MTDWRFLIEKWVLRHHRPGPYEPEVWKDLKRIRGELFVDIGANIGRYAIRLRRNFQTVLAVEPNPRVVLELENRIRASKARNIKVLPYAISEMPGVVTLYLNPHPGFSESANTILSTFEYKPAYNPSLDHMYVGSEGVQVEARTFDQLVDGPSDLVKIDVEGAEFLVLSSMARAMRAGEVRRLLVELHNRDRREELERLLTRYGYDFEWLTGPRVKWILGDHCLAWL